MSREQFMRSMHEASSLALEVVGSLDEQVKVDPDALPRVDLERRLENAARWSSALRRVIEEMEEGLVEAVVIETGDGRS